MNSKYTEILTVAIVCAIAVCSARTVCAQSTHDPCKLLLQVEVGSAVGTSVGPGKAIGTTGCEWSAPNARVSLVLSDAAGWETMKTPLPGVTKTPATDIGADAFYTAVGTLATLSVKKGSTVFVVRIYGVHDQSKQMSVEKTLARNVLANM